MIKNRFYSLRKKSTTLKDKLKVMARTGPKKHKIVTKDSNDDSSLAEENQDFSCSTQGSPGSEHDSQQVQQPANSAEISKLSKKITKVVPVAKVDWSEDQDGILKDRAEHYKKHWKKISKKFKKEGIKASPPFLKRRFSILCGEKCPLGVPFSEEEDLKLAELHAKHGSRCLQIAREFQTRTPEMLKNRYYRHIRNKIEIKKEKPVEEDAPSLVSEIQPQVSVNNVVNSLPNFVPNFIQNSTPMINL